MISVILTIIVLNFHFRGPKKQRVPKWMRKYIIGYLGKLFCFWNETRALESIQKDTKIKKTLYKNESNISGQLNTKLPIFNKLNQKQNFDIISNKNKTNIDNNDNNEIEYCYSQSEPAYVKSASNRLTKITTENNEYNLKENRIVLEYTNDTIDSLLNQKNPPSMDKCIDIARTSKEQSKSKKDSLKKSGKEIPFNDEISKNLEKMLIKMQKSFDPFKLQDENLKFAILKEILECQRLLLSANITNKKEKQLSINDIFDEWKILAMIVDRVCFFIYLSALVISTGLFFLREQVYSDL